MESFWTEKKIKKLKELLTKGLSTSEIGRKLGVSKNTVIGKIHRLKHANDLELTKINDTENNCKKIKKGLFSFSKKQPSNKSVRVDVDIESASKISIKDKVSIETKLKLTSVIPLNADSTEKDSISDDFLRDEQFFLKNKNKDKRYQLRDLKSDMCRWAYGEPNSANFCFCGQKTIGSKPYCLKHSKMAYVIKKNDS